MGELNIQQKITNQERGDDVSPITVSEEESKKLVVYTRGAESHHKRGFTYFELDADMWDKYVFPLDKLDKVLRFFFILQSKFLLFKAADIAKHCLSYQEKALKNGHLSVKYYDCEREHVSMGELLKSKKLAGCSVPLSALGTVVSSSFQKVLENPNCGLMKA